MLVRKHERKQDSQSFVSRKEAFCTDICLEIAISIRYSWISSLSASNQYSHASDTLLTNLKEKDKLLNDVKKFSYI